MKWASVGDRTASARGSPTSKKMGGTTSPASSTTSAAKTGSDRSNRRRPRAWVAGSAAAIMRCYRRSGLEIGGVALLHLLDAALDAGGILLQQLDRAHRHAAGALLDLGMPGAHG